MCVDNCIFCKIANHEMDAKIVYENEHVVAFLDIFPASDGHCLVIPKTHFNNLSACDNKTLNQVIEAVKKVSELISTKLDVHNFNYLSNQGKLANQAIDHFHFHVIPKYDEHGWSGHSDPKLKYELDTILKKLVG